jgi:hypothetical protein
VLKPPRGRGARLTVACLVALLAAVDVPAGFPGTDLFIPSVGRAQGIATWYTTIWVHNPGSEPAYARFTFLERDRDNTGATETTGRIDPGETERFAAIPAMEGRFGAYRVTSSVPLLVTSRIYSMAGGERIGASKGQDFAAIPAALAIGAGRRTRILGVYQTLPEVTEMRYNFGFVETTGHACTVRVTPLDDLGVPVAAARSYAVLPLGQHQFQLRDEFPEVWTVNAVLDVEVVSGSGRVIAFGSLVTNGSQDPTTFEMGFDGALLDAVGQSQ